MKYFVLALLLVSFKLHSQEIPTKDGKGFYEFIDSGLNKPQIQVYNTAKLWAADAFKNAKAVLQVDDKETGEISGKGLFTWNQGITPYKCWFTMRITARDNKYRLQFYDMRILAGTMEAEETLEWYLAKPNAGYSKKIFKQVDENIRKLAASLDSKEKQAGDNF